MRTEHLPQRTCIACRQKKEKNALIRLVRTSEGSVEVDLSTKKPGRGAYLCRQKDCWDLALEGNRLEHALRTKLSNGDRQVLLTYTVSRQGEMGSE
jgi:predicted RNA-binding protein YlxR (DUF448 family)